MSIDKLLIILDKSEKQKKTKAIRNIRKENSNNNKKLRDIRTLYESDKEDYYKPIRIGNAFSSNYIEYESNGDKDKTLFIDDYLDMIRQFLSDIINHHKTQGEWKIQLTMEISFISSKACDETRTIHTKCDNIETMIGNEVDEIIKKLFKSLLQKYQQGLEKSMKGSEFNVDIVDILYYKLHRKNLNRRGSYIDSPE